MHNTILIPEITICVTKEYSLYYKLVIVDTTAAPALHIVFLLLV